MSPMFIVLESPVYDGAEYRGLSYRLAVRTGSVAFYPLDTTYTTYTEALRARDAREARRAEHTARNEALHRG